MVYIKNYIFNNFYFQYLVLLLVLLNMIPRNSMLRKVLYQVYILVGVKYKISIDYLAQGKILATLSPLCTAGSWRRRYTVYGRMLTYPLRFNTWGTREIVGTHARAFLKKRNVPREFGTRILDYVKNARRLPTKYTITGGL